MLSLLSATPVVANPEFILEQIPVDALDWEPLAIVPLSEQDLHCQQCGGRYKDPLAGISASDPLTTPIEIMATESQIEGPLFSFSGEVTLKQGNRTLRADNVDFDRQQQAGTAAGHVTLREPGVLLIGNRASYTNNPQEAELEQATFVLHETNMHGGASSLKHTATGDIEIKSGVVSYCAPDDPEWFLRADTIRLQPDKGVGEARSATLELKGVPIFYLPWVQFPLDDERKTGLLFPSIGSDTRGGLDVTAPLYLNLAPNYDATYLPRYIAERGLNHQLEARLLDDTTGFWQVNGAYLDNDKKYRDETAGASGNRWLTSLRHRGETSAKWRTTIDYTRVSDVDYIRDLDNQSLSVQRQTALLQLGQVDYLGENWLISLQAQQFQTLADDIRNDYKKLPQVSATWRGDSRWQRLQPIAFAQYSRFDADGNRVTGDRMYAEVGASYPMQREWGYFRPTLKYRAVDYRLDNSPLVQNTQPNAGSAVASIDTGITLERSIEFKGESLTQTLEPRLFYLYAQYANQTDQPFFDSAELTFSYAQMYQDTRFSGHDRLDDANQVTLGVTTRLFSNEDGRERMNASIGQIVYFRDRDVRLNSSVEPLTEQTSAYALEFNWLPSDQMSIRSSVLYDSNRNELDAATVYMNYQPGDGAVFNASYTLREPPPSLLTRPVTEQANLSAYYPIDNNWRMFGAIDYSLEASQSVQDMLGVEYDNCCWQVRLLYMRYVDTVGELIPDFSDPTLERERAVQFQFVIKGLGGFGMRVENLLTDMIRGFNDRY